MIFWAWLPFKQLSGLDDNLVSYKRMSVLNLLVFHLIISKVLKVLNGLIPYQTKIRWTKFLPDKTFRWTKSALTRNFGTFIRWKYLSVEFVSRILLICNSFFVMLFAKKKWYLLECVLLLPIFVPMRQHTSQKRVTLM